MQTVDVKIPCSENKSYQIFIGDNTSEKFPEIINMISSRKILVVTNETIYEIFSDKIKQIYACDGKIVEYCILPDGETYKNKNSLETILTCAFEAKLERNDVMVAFGGGVIGDITGFAAAIYLRGINFVQVPTTILAQVDSSVGGKVAVNTPYGKNLLGAFYQPKVVISDLNFLKTLPEREILTGLAEVVKYSFIEKSCGTEFSDFAQFLYANQSAIIKLETDKISTVIETSCKLKAKVVEQDEKEKGLRAILNFGHTIGHAIEKCTNYNQFTHGEAVVMGMKAVFIMALAMGKINEEYYKFSLDLLKSYKLDFKIPQNISTEQIMDALLYDKKVQNGAVRFVIPVGYAKVEIFNNVNKNVIENALKELY